MPLSQGLPGYLRALRESRNWSLRELASRSGLSNGYLSLLENGRVANPSASVLGRLAEAFGVPAEDVLRAAGLTLVTTATKGVDPQLVSALRRLDPDARAELVSYANYLAGRQGGRRRR